MYYKRQLSWPKYLQMIIIMSTSQVFLLERIFFPQHDKVFSSSGFSLVWRRATFFVLLSPHFNLVIFVYNSADSALSDIIADVFGEHFSDMFASRRHFPTCSAITSPTFIADVIADATSPTCSKKMHSMLAFFVLSFIHD